MQNPKVALITGGARRIGAAIAAALHQQGMNVVIHYRSSASEAQALQAKLNALRPDSAAIVQADLLHYQQLKILVTQAMQQWGRLDVLINNASSFYPTPVAQTDEAQWDELMGSNLKAPFFLSQAAAPFLAAQQGCIINIVDIHAHQPLKSYPIYCMAKAGLVMMTKALAKELGPAIRVNAIAPGAILWPEEGNELDNAIKEKIIGRTALKRAGTPNDVAAASLFLVEHANYMTGQILNIDGGRSFNY